MEGNWNGNQKTKYYVNLINIDVSMRVIGWDIGREAGSYWWVEGNGMEIKKLINSSIRLI